MRPLRVHSIGDLRFRASGGGLSLPVDLNVAVSDCLPSEALKGKKPTRNANSKIKVNKEAGPISPVLMD